MTKTVLLTGISGFIAKRIAFDLLQEGHAVRGTLRSLSRADEVREAVGPEGLDRLTFVEADLTGDAGWDAAMEGVDAVLHTASPFPLVQPKDEQELIRPAVDGTLRVLRAARKAGVTRIVMTASMVSIMYKAAPDNGRAFDESDWSDLDHPMSSAYVKSKTLAEKAARDFVAEHPEMTLTTIHPGLVAGTPMDRHYGTSLGVVERILAAKDPMQPDVAMPIVDVADVSALHLAALRDQTTAGRRLIAVAGMMTFPEIAGLLADAYPDRKISRRTAPKLLLRGLALFDKSINTIINEVGVERAVDNSASLPVLGRDFVSARDAILASAAFVTSKGGGSKAAA